MPAPTGVGMKRARRREREIPASGCCDHTTRIVIGSKSRPGAGWRSARYAAAPKDLDDDHAAAAARAWRALIGGGVEIGCILRCQRLDLWGWGSDELLGVCDIGFARHARQQPVVADAVETLGQNVEQTLLRITPPNTH